MLLLGTAQCPLNPPLGLQMAGYMDRRLPSQGNHDELYLRASVFSDSGEGQNFFLVVYDLLSIPMKWREQVTSRLQGLLSLSRVEVVLVSTHTHSGPDVSGGKSEEMDYAGKVLDLTVAACCAAYEAKEPCTRMEVSSENVRGVGSIRRFGREVSLPLTVQLFYIGDSATVPRLALLHFPCHPTVLSADNLLYSAEYPGIVVNKVQEKLGRDTMVCFLNGAAGDISTRFTRREQTFSEVERLGSLVASAAQHLITSSPAVVTTHPQMEILVKDVVLQPQSPPAEYLLTHLRQQLEETENSLESDEQARRIRHTQAQALQVLETGDYSQRIPVHVSLAVLSFPGLLNYVFWPGEPFSGYAAAVRSQNPQTVLVGYAGYIGYLPDIDSEEDPSYEILMSIYGREGGQLLLEHSKAMLEALGGKGGITDDFG